jgi:hypothetical protein
LLQVRISPYLWRRVKTASGAECVSIGKFVSTLLEQHVPNVPACYPNPDVLLCAEAEKALLKAREV